VPRPSPILPTLAILTFVFVGPGCGHDGDHRTAVPPDETADGMTAGVEKIIDRFNELSMRTPVVDAAAIIDLLHAENERQERVVATMRASLPLLELDQALWDRFGAGVTPGQTAPPLAPIREPARLTTSIGHRATAAYTRSDGTPGKLFLVNTDGTWRLSAHSFDQSVIDGAAAALEARERMNRYLAPYAPAITARIRDGHFASTAEAGFALGQAVAAEHPEVREHPGLMFGE
jgi:hypothetical protein